LADPGGICVSARVQEDAAGRLDLAFDDLGEQSLKNINRPIRVYRVRLATVENTPKVTPTVGPPVLPLPDKPSIAVLPFANMSGDPEQEYFADGMVEEIITALSRIRWLFVIARNSSFTYKGHAVDVKQVGRELGVRYVLEGSVRRADGRVRITGQLIDALSGTHLWADRFDGSLEDIFEIQDKVAISVAGVIEPTLQSAEIRRAANRPTNDLTAYDLYLRAYAMQLSSAPEALRLLDQAIERDPQYGPALALAAVFHGESWIAGWSKDPEADSNASADLAWRALRVAGDDPITLSNAALALGPSSEDISAMMGLVDRALALNPSLLAAGTSAAFCASLLGNPNEPSSTPRPRCVSARAPSSARLTGSSAPRIWSACASTRAAKAPAGDPRGSRLPYPLSLARLVLRPHGAARRGERYHQAPARHYPGCGSARHAVSKSGTPGAIAIWPAVGRWRSDMSQTRRLAAILAADVAGYSRLMGADEEGTHERLKALRSELLDPKIAQHHGRIVKTAGDGMLVEFASVVDAVR
jgi:TolB-like protein